MHTSLCNHVSFQNMIFRIASHYMEMLIFLVPSRRPQDCLLSCPPCHPTPVPQKEAIGSKGNHRTLLTARSAPGLRPQASLTICCSSPALAGPGLSGTGL